MYLQLPFYIKTRSTKHKIFNIYYVYDITTNTWLYLHFDPGELIIVPGFDYGIQQAVVKSIYINAFVNQLHAIKAMYASFMYSMHFICLKYAINTNFPYH